MNSISSICILLGLSVSLAACGMQEAAQEPKDFDPGQQVQPGTQPAETALPGGGIAAFYEPIRAGQLPELSSLTSSEFLDQFSFALPSPGCDTDLCLQASLAQGPTFISNQPSAMLTMGLNSTVDPSTLTGAPRHIALVIDTSEVLQGATIQDVRRALTELVKSLKSKDLLTIFAVGTQADMIVDEVGTQELDLQDKLVGVGAFNLYDGLRRALDHLAKNKQANRRSILMSIALSDPSAGIVQQARLENLLASYPDLDRDFHAIAIGSGLTPKDYRDLARAGRGHFHFLESTQGLDALLRSPQALSRVTLARNIDIRLALGSGYRLRSVFGARVHSQNESHVTVRVPTFDLVAQPGDDNESGSSQKVIVAELEPSPQARDRVAELDFSYLKDTEEGEDRIQGQSRLVLAPPPSQSRYFESDAARRAFVLISIFTAYRRALALVAQDDVAGAQLMLHTLFEALKVWVQNSAADPAIVAELLMLDTFKALVSDEKAKAQPGDTPVIDPIIDAAPLR